MGVAASEAGDSDRATFGIAFTGSEPWSIVAARAARLDGVEPITNLWVFDERFNRDPWVTLGLLAGVTDRLVLGTCVTDPLIRHPALTGTAIATLSEATSGRAVLGLGAGVSGFHALGIERKAPATALREAIDFLRAFWSGSRVDFQGSAFSFQGGAIHFPVGPIPIAVAGRGPRILELAGRVADMVLVATFTDGPLLDHALDSVARGEAARSADLPPLRRAAWVYTSVATDRDAARAAVREGIAVALWGSRPILDALGIALPAGLRDLMDAVPYAATPEILGRAAALVPDDFVDTCAVAGDPAECISRLGKLIERGFDHLALWPFAPPGQSIDAVVDRLVSEVLPAVERRPSIPTGRLAR